MDNIDIYQAHFNEIFVARNQLKICGIKLTEE